MNQSGSVVIVVIACIAFACLLGTNSVHTAWCCSDSVYKKQLYEQRLQSVQGLLTYGLVVSKKLKDDWLRQGITVWYKDVASVPCGAHGCYSGNLYVECTPAIMHIVAELIIDKKKVITSSCNAVITSGNDLVVQGWRMHEA